MVREEVFYDFGEAAGVLPRKAVSAVGKDEVLGIREEGETFLGEGGEFFIVLAGDPEEGKGDFFELGAEVFLLAERPMVEAFGDGVAC